MLRRNIRASSALATLLAVVPWHIVGQPLATAQSPQAPAKQVAVPGKIALVPGKTPPVPGKSLPDVTNSLPLLRQAYIQEVRTLKDTAAQLRAAGRTPEEIARTLHQMRRDLGIKYKHLTPPELLATIYQRNLTKYGDQLDPTIDYLRRQGKSWKEIIESASRPGGADLGLSPTP